MNAHDWLDQLQSGRVQSQREMAKQAGVTESFLGRMMSLAFLAPDIVEAALEGNQPGKHQPRSIPRAEWSWIGNSSAMGNS